MNYLLNGYASNYPGSRGLDDEVVEQDEITSTKPTKKSNTPNTTAAELLRNSTASSAFGAELKKGLPVGNTVDYRSINITSQISYAGNKQSFDLNSLLVDVPTIVSSEGLRGHLP